VGCQNLGPGGCGGGGHAPEVTDALSQVVAAGVPGALALVRDGDRTRMIATGLADVDAPVKLRASDRFRVGSVTKTFVATVVLQLAAERRVRLDEPVERWLPGLLPDGERITIRHLRLGDQFDREPSNTAGSQPSFARYIASGGVGIGAGDNEGQGATAPVILRGRSR
jgi:Beta-lactamase